MAARTFTAYVEYGAEMGDEAADLPQFVGIQQIEVVYEVL